MLNPTPQDWAKWQAHKSNKDRWIEEQEEMRCEDCGQTPDEGACFYCKMD